MPPWLLGRAAAALQSQPAKLGAAGMMGAGGWGGVLTLAQRVVVARVHEVEAARKQHADGGLPQEVAGGGGHEARRGAWRELSAGRGQHRHVAAGA